MNRLLTCALLACAALSSASAQTYVSAEPIPSPDIVGTANLIKILNLGYPNLELWSQRLLNDCHIVQNVINVLSEHRAITTVNSANTRYKVAAGGFEAVTDPTYVLTFDDSSPAAASASDIFVSGGPRESNDRVPHSTLGSCFVRLKRSSKVPNRLADAAARGLRRRQAHRCDEHRGHQIAKHRMVPV